MNGYHLFKSLGLVLTLGLVVVGGLAACIFAACQEISRELTLQHEYADSWRIVYAEHFGSLADGRFKIVVGILGTIIIPSLVFGLSRALRPEWQKSGGNRRPRRSRHGSTLDRTGRCRRNALVGIGLGIAGLLAGAALVLFHWGIFADHENELILGFLVYFGGYFAIIGGCWWWLKAKEWTEEVAFIGLMPLAVLFVPFVRLIFFASPILLAVSMGMMALVLIAVVFALPDKSGPDGRGGSGNRWHRNRRH